jgi:mRNA interferase HigB
VGIVIIAPSLGLLYKARVRVVGRQRLIDFTQKHERARSSVQSWLAEASEAEWERPLDVKQRFPHMSIVNDHYVFNIGGNKFRLDTRINFETRTVLVLRIGTHQQYETWSFN